MSNPNSLPDHRVIGRQLDLFSISDEVGPGLILWHPHGTALRQVVEDFSRAEHIRRGYAWVQTPHIGRADLWRTSGHLDFYSEAMFPEMVVDGRDRYYVKPMSCPFHIQIFRSQARSYRDLPKRYVEIAAVYRYELSGVVGGLTRPRGFTQDDAHIFCLPDEAEAEVVAALGFAVEMLQTFGLRDFRAYLSTKPSKAVGRNEDWRLAEAALRTAIQASGVDFEVDAGGGAFYGPKTDLKVRDAHGREWQLSTIQFDFNEPERFGLQFIAADGQPRRPLMIHRALYGSVERFLGVLIEHYAGAFPLWLAPVQVQLVPIAERHNEYLSRFQAQLREAGIRAELDGRNESARRKIANAQAMKVPYTVLAGDRDVASGTVSPRLRDGRQLDPLPAADFLARLQTEVAERR